MHPVVNATPTLQANNTIGSWTLNNTILLKFVFCNLVYKQILICRGVRPISCRKLVFIHQAKGRDAWVSTDINTFPLQPYKSPEIYGQKAK